MGWQVDFVVGTVLVLTVSWWLIKWLIKAAWKALVNLIVHGG